MNLEKVARNLVAFRIKAGLNQDEASKLLGISRQTLSMWENNTGNLTLEKLNLLAEVYGCNSKSFLMD